MALATHIAYGPTLNDRLRYPGLPAAFEFTGVTDGDAGWAKDDSLAGWSVSSQITEAAASTVYWYFFYYVSPASLTSGKAKAVQRLKFQVLEGIFAIEHYADIQFYNDAGTYKFRLARDQSTQEAISSTARALSTKYLICVRVDTSTDVVTVFVNQASDVTFDYTEAGMLGWHGNPPTPNGNWYSGPSDEAVFAHWSSIGGRSDATDTEDETQYPEAHQHLPTANGNYTAYKSSATGTTPGDWNMWKDTAFDEDATYNQCVPSSKQTSQVAARTYANTVVGLTWLGRLRDVLANKNAPHSALLRQSGTDKEKALSAANSTNYGNFVVCFNAPPTGSWDLDGTPVLEAGHSSGAVAGALINVTSILCEGIALGTTDKSPPMPPAAAAAVARPLEILQSVKRASIF